MKFLELAPGISVNISSIDVFTKSDKGGTTVSFGDQNWATAIPYETFKQLLVRHMDDGGIARDIRQLAQQQATPTP